MALCIPQLLHVRVYFSNRWHKARSFVRQFCCHCTECHLPMTTCINGRRHAKGFRTRPPVSTSDIDLDVLPMRLRSQRLVPVASHLDPRHEICAQPEPRSNPPRQRQSRDGSGISANRARNRGGLTPLLETMVMRRR